VSRVYIDTVSSSAYRVSEENIDVVKDRLLSGKESHVLMQRCPASILTKLMLFTPLTRPGHSTNLHMSAASLTNYRHMESSKKQYLHRAQHHRCHG
jgi:hypothetical protein